MIQILTESGFAKVLGRASAPCLLLEHFQLVCLFPGEFEAGSITSIFSNRAVVKYSRLEDVLHGCSWKINNKLDGTYLPLPVDKIIQRTKNMINKIVQYSLIEGNCEHFVNDLRYGVPRSQQVCPRVAKDGQAKLGRHQMPDTVCWAVLIM